MDFLREPVVLLYLGLFHPCLQASRETTEPAHQMSSQCSRTTSGSFYLGWFLVRGNMHFGFQIQTLANQLASRPLGQCSCFGNAALHRIPCAYCSLPIWLASWTHLASSSQPDGRHFSFHHSGFCLWTFWLGRGLWRLQLCTR